MTNMDPAADIHQLLCHYNNLYFGGELCSCVVSWSKNRNLRCMYVCNYVSWYRGEDQDVGIGHTGRNKLGYLGTCLFEDDGYCEIELSKPLLLHRPAIDIKNSLLHEMIHAYLWIKYHNANHGDHGKNFQEIANGIESSSMDDNQRPNCGYKISLDHDLRKEDSSQVSKQIKDVDKSCSCKDVEELNREPSNVDPCSCHIQIASPGNHGKMGELSRSSDNTRDSEGETDEVMLLEYRPTTVPCDVEQKQGGNNATTSSENCNVLESNKASSEDPTSSRRRRKFGTHVARRSKEKGIAIRETNNYRDFYLVDSERKFSSGYNSLGGKSNKKREFVLIREHKVNEAQNTHQNSHWQMLKKRRWNGGSSNKQRKEYDVIVPLLNWYFSEEDAEEDEPLVNKRTERRKKQRLLLNKRKGVIPEGENMVGSSSIMPCDEVKSGSSEVEKMNEDDIIMGCPVTPVVASQGGNISPDIVNIVEISDG